VKVTNLANGVINPDSSVTIAVTVAPEAQLEADFLGFCVATVDGPAPGQTPLAAIAAEAASLKLSIPGLT
jgi:hypothetical protein